MSMMPSVTVSTQIVISFIVAFVALLTVNSTVIARGTALDSKHSLTIDRMTVSRDARYFRLIAEMGNRVKVDVRKINVEEN
jgi:hypothetical protein